MDLQFKKLLLLSMQMNDANELMIKASPNRVVNLQLYANVSIKKVPLVKIQVILDESNRV